MRRATKEQITITLLLEIVAVCLSLAFAVVVKGLGYFLSLFLEVSFYDAWLRSFILLSVIVVLLNIWGFVGRVKNIKRLARKFGASFNDMSEAIHEHGFFGEVVGDLPESKEESFKIWLKEKREDAETMTVIEIL